MEAPSYPFSANTSVAESWISPKRRSKRVSAEEGCSRARVVEEEDMRFDFRTFVLILFSPGQFGNPLDAKPGIPQRHPLWPSLRFRGKSLLLTDVAGGHWRPKNGSVDKQRPNRQTAPSRRFCSTGP